MRIAIFIIAIVLCVSSYSARVDRHSPLIALGGMHGMRIWGPLNSSEIMTSCSKSDLLLFSMKDSTVSELYLNESKSLNTKGMHLIELTRSGSCAIFVNTTSIKSRSKIELIVDYELQISIESDGNDRKHLHFVIREKIGQNIVSRILAEIAREEPSIRANDLVNFVETTVIEQINRREKLRSQSRLAIQESRRIYDELVIVVGASSTIVVPRPSRDYLEPPWIYLSIHALDITDRADFVELFDSENSIDTIVAEHVLEHLSLPEAIVAVDHFFCFIRPGGLLRIAVPEYFRASDESKLVHSHDSVFFSQDSELANIGSISNMLADMKVGNVLEKDILHGHQIQYSVYSLISLLESVGFYVFPQEWIDSSYQAYHKNWNPHKGNISRSHRYRSRTRSIIVDAYKPHNSSGAKRQHIRRRLVLYVEIYSCPLEVGNLYQTQFCLIDPFNDLFWLLQVWPHLVRKLSRSNIEIIVATVEKHQTGWAQTHGIPLSEVVDQPNVEVISWLRYPNVRSGMDILLVYSPAVVPSVNELEPQINRVILLYLQHNSKCTIAPSFSSSVHIKLLSTIDTYICEEENRIDLMIASSGYNPYSYFLEQHDEILQFRQYVRNQFHLSTRSLSDEPFVVALGAVIRSDGQLSPEDIIIMHIISVLSGSNTPIWLLILGGTLSADIHALIRESRVTYVHIPGFTDARTRRIVFNSALALVYTPSTTATHIRVMEVVTAMACGCPVILSTHPGLDALGASIKSQQYFTWSSIVILFSDNDELATWLHIRTLYEDKFGGTSTAELTYFSERVLAIRSAYALAVRKSWAGWISLINIVQSAILTDT